MNIPFGKNVAVIGLGFGDEGKGTMVDYLTSAFDYSVVVKSSGGAQCAHHVVLPDGSVHRFAQFGSGTFNGAMTLLSRFFLVDPLRLSSEADALERLGVVDPYDMIMADRRCLITTPLHAAANRVRELRRGADAHGSCGIGIGETVHHNLVTDDGLRVGDLASEGLVYNTLTHMLNHYRSELGDEFTELLAEEFCIAGGDDLRHLVEAYLAFYARVAVLSAEDMDFVIQTNTVVFEGSQGVLLDEWYGFHPYTTWSTTTFANADALALGQEVYHLGVMRAYTTRHGAGPFPTEVPVDEMPPELHNGTGRFQGGWRSGHFDALLMKYAIDVCGRVDGLAVTHLDRPTTHYSDHYAGNANKGYSITGLEPKHPDNIEDLDYQLGFTEFLSGARPVLRKWDWNDKTVTEVIADRLQTPVVVESYGPTADDKVLQLEMALA